MVTPGYLAFHPNPKKPDIELPARACDTHCHVFGPADRFPYSPASSYIPVDAPKEVLFQRHKFLGIDRAVIVQASCHGTDNAAMLEAVRTGGDAYRGIAILAPDVSEAQLAAMHEIGVRGVRFNFVKRLKARQPEAVRWKIIEKISRFGWHIVVYLEPEDLSDVRDFLSRIPMPVVIDHMARLPMDKGAQSAEFEAVAQLLADDRFWIKVTGPERLSKEGPPYNDTHEVSRALMRLAPDRVLWGTDWPHPNMTTHVPDEGILVDRIGIICEDEDQRQALLVDNPTRLYWND